MVPHIDSCGSRTISYRLFSLRLCHRYHWPIRTLFEEKIYCLVVHRSFVLTGVVETSEVAKVSGGLQFQVIQFVIVVANVFVLRTDGVGVVLGAIK